MARLVIFGAGDIARLAHYYFSRDSPHEVVAFAVDDQYRRGDEFQGLPLVAASELAERFPPAEHQAFVAMSYARMNRLRAEKFHWVRDLGYECASYVSSRCSWLTDHPVGVNCFVLEDNTVQPFSRIGDNVTLWSGNHIGHDSVIEDHCFVSSHVVISGWVRVESYCFLGVNSTFRDNITIAQGTLVGAGAAIMKDTEPGAIYVPPRAQKLDKTSDQVSL